MSKQHNAPFYRSTSKSVLWIFFLLALISTFAFARFFVEYEQHQQVAQHQLPQFEKLQRAQALIVETSQTLTQVLQASSAAPLPELQHTLTKQFDELRTLNQTVFNKVILPKSEYYQTGSIDSNLQRLASNSETNQILRGEAIEQLKVIVEKLQKETLDKEVQLEQLYQQIVNDNASDRITVNRAKAHASLTQNVNNFYQLDQLSIASLGQLQSLTIQTKQQAFERLAANLTRILAIFERLNQAALINDNSLIEHMATFEKLLFTERLGVSKWRGHLRIAEPYLTAIALQKTQLLNSLTQKNNTSNNPLTGSNLLVVLANQHIFSAIGTFRVNATQLNQSLYIGLALCGFLLLMALVSLRQKAKAFGQQTIDICQQAEQQSDEQSIDLTKATHEQATIAELIVNLKKPAHGEADYQALLQQHQQQLTTLNQQHLCTYWHQNERIDEALSLLNWQQVPTNIAQLISRFDAACKKPLIQSLRLAIESNKPQHIELHHGEHYFAILLNFDGHYFHGSIADISEKKALISQIAQLENDLNNLNLQDTEHDIAQAEYVKKLTTSLLLHNQQVLVSQNVSSLKVHRRLLNLINLCDRESTIKTLSAENHTLALSDFAFKQHLETVVHNLILRLQSQKHEIFLNIDDKISDIVNNDMQCIEQLFEELGLTMLQETLNSRLTISLVLTDQNPGKQLVRIQASLALTNAKAEHVQSSFARIESLAQSLENQQPLATSTLTATGTQTLAQLFKVLHVTNVECLQQQSEISLAFDLPLATEESRINQNKFEQLADISVLLLSNDGNENDGESSHIMQAFKQCGAHIENLANLIYLPQHLSVGHLEKNPIDAVVLSADFYTAGLTPVQRHINALPKHLQPKLLVIQPLLNAPLQRHGLYSLANMPLTADMLRQKTTDLLASTTGSNLDIAASAFEMVRPRAVNSEVLLAVATPEKHLALIRLLNWFGLQVTIANSEQGFAKLWRSGRYLLTVTEFKQSPFTELAQGNIARRAVFHFTEQQFAALSQDEQTIASKWQVELLPELTQVSALYQLLMPWLLQPESKASEQQKLPDVSESTSKQTKAKTEAHNTASAKAFIDIPDDPAFDSDLSDVDFLTAIGNYDDIQETDAPFSFNQFVINQGAPALAAVMIDDYLQAIADALTGVNLKIAEQDTGECSKLLAVISLNAKIIAANDLVNLVADTQEALTQNDKALAKKLLTEIEHAYTDVVDYAEAI